MSLFRILFGSGKRRARRSLISEPINIVTGALGAGKTLFAIEQADLLRRAGDADIVYQVGINNPDLRKLPALPFPIEEWAERADRGELKNAVIIVDEFHKWMPQRPQNSRPPKWIEELAETRRRDVRWLLLTQSGEFDHFLKGTRCNRHFYVSRRSGLGRATIFEWSARFVSNPEENKDARAIAIKHPWRHPVKEYGDWYESAMAHRFRPRLPLRAFLALLFIPAAVFFVWRGVSGFSSVIGGSLGEASATPAGEDAALERRASSRAEGREGRTVVTDDLETYIRQFTPLHPTLRWSMPAFQGRQVQADPQLVCVKSGDGYDVNGEFIAGRCQCFTEQMTRVAVDLFDCEAIVRDGLYNPFKSPRSEYASGGEPDGKGSLSPRPAAAALPAPTSGAGPGGEPAYYGGMRETGW